MPMSKDDIARTEASVRTAAIAAARGVPLGEAILEKIVAETNQPGLSVADRVSRAAVMAEQYAASPKPLNAISASPQEVAAQTAALAFVPSRFNGAIAQPVGLGERGSGKGSYQALGSSDLRNLQTITSASFGSSAFASAGLDFGTLAYLRNQDRSFTAQNVLNAANDAKALGFGPRDRAAMLDHATIDRRDPKARATNKALQDYQERIESDDELSDLSEKAREAKTPEARKMIDAQIAAKRARHAEETGLAGRIMDSTNHPKAVAATKRRKTAIEKRAEQNYQNCADAKHAGTPPTLVVSKAGSDLFKKLTTSPN